MDLTGPRGNLTMDRRKLRTNVCGLPPRQRSARKSAGVVFGRSNRHTLRCGFDFICAIAVGGDVLSQGDTAAELVSENVGSVQDKDQLHLSLSLSVASLRTTNESGRLETFAMSSDLQIMVQTLKQSPRRLVRGSSSSRSLNADIGTWKTIAFASARYGIHAGEARCARS